MTVTRRLGGIVFFLIAATLLQAKGGFLLFSGAPLTQPVAIATPEQLVRFNRSGQIRLRQPDAASLMGRPYLEVGFYFGPAWETFFRDGGRVEDLRPEKADSRGRFYPARGSEPAILEIPGSKQPYMSLSDDGLQLLRDLGVPVRIGP